jgi:hypothetical protein
MGWAIGQRVCPQVPFEGVAVLVVEPLGWLRRRCRYDVLEVSGLSCQRVERIFRGNPWAVVGLVAPAIH